jgi:hypothetical protein
MTPLSPLLYLVPIWMLFELGQLVLGERFLGLKQIERGEHPRDLGPGEWVAFSWTAALLLYWVWMGLMLTQPIGRAQIVAMLGISALGFLVRRSCALKWVLVTLTLEGAIRLGMLFSLGVAVWRL